MKRWLILGTILSALLIGVRYLMSFIVTRSININSVEEGLVPILEMFQFPPPLLEVLISSIIVGFLAGILINLAYKKVKEVMEKKK